jgi:hypothetical protein
MAQQPLVDQGPLFIQDSRSHSVRHTTLGIIPLEEGSARRSDLYRKTHNTHKRQTSTSAGGIRTRNPRKRTATGIGFKSMQFKILSHLEENSNIS